MTKRAMATAMRMAGDKEGNGKDGKDDGDINKVVGNKEVIGKGSNVSSDGNEDGGQ